jgi:HPt (histidine-containing phosphotransfer) domain-containing protein
MTVKEFYEEIGVDVRVPLHRFADSERMLLKFLHKVKDDPTYGSLKQFTAEQNWGEAFRAAHTLKGVSLNLELTPLAKVSQELTEYLRHYDSTTPSADRAEVLLADVTREYDRAIALITQLDE